MTHLQGTHRPLSDTTIPGRMPTLSEQLDRYRAERRRRLRQATLTRQHSGRWPTEQEELIRFARIWAPYGGPPPEEVFVRFGITSTAFAERIRQMLATSRYDRRTTESLTLVYTKHPA
ncbi:hypothetical protein I1A62_45430 [Rhodococcus sp. USK10]|uniref:hypothetical protein n=1 Tax=Rhodococcus sp. USK10 TaxID=2789739 RepID=UPI001C5E473B|nr:hypothetical protein [Rhodococcus sp. USK10]QYB04238.1 hypothetical protein I1A62_45430 [Rhodococcus sp. USK10]